MATYKAASPLIICGCLRLFTADYMYVTMLNNIPKVVIAAGFVGCCLINAITSQT
jgi:hypothetical protein